MSSTSIYSPVCKHCLKTLSTFTDPANHVRWCPNRTQVRGDDEITRICTHCSKEFKIKRNLRRYTCSLECRHTHKEETKIQIAEKRSLYLKDNPESHPWKKSTKFQSVPCENLKNLLRLNGFNFREEHSPLTNRHFSIDIAFPDQKVGIEVNGNQHYADGKLKPYYQNRHDLLTSQGWNILEVHYSKCFKKETMQVVVDWVACQIGFEPTLTPLQATL